MKRTVILFVLFSITVFLTFCGQNLTNIPQENTRSSRKPLPNYTESQLKEADTSRVPVSMVRNVKLTRNGDILIAYLGVFRYDARLNDTVGQGTSFTNLTGKIISPRFSSLGCFGRSKRQSLVRYQRFRYLLLQWEIPAYRSGRLSAFYNKGGACQQSGTSYL